MIGSLMHEKIYIMGILSEKQLTVPNDTSIFHTFDIRNYNITNLVIKM